MDDWTMEEWHEYFLNIDEEDINMNYVDEYYSLFTAKWSTISSLEEAKAFIDSIMIDMADEDVQRIFYAFVGETPPAATDEDTRDYTDVTQPRTSANMDDYRTYSDVATYGGGDTKDPYLYELLKVVDTFHDYDINEELWVSFHANRDMEDRSLIHDWFETGLMQRPDGIEIRDIEIKNDFIDKITAREMLEYPDGTRITNSLHGLRISILKGDDAVCENEIFGNISTNIWVAREPTTSNDEEQLVQLATLCAALRKSFGQQTTFFIDSTKPLTLAMLSLRHLNEAFGERLLDPIIIRNRIIQGGVTTTHHLSWITKIKKRILDSKSECCVCDAHWIDGTAPLKDVRRSTVATGNVYEDGCLYQVHLGGIHEVKSKQGVKQKVIVGYTEQGVQEIKSVFEKDLTFSKGAVATLVEDRAKNPGVVNADLVELFARKRAGDWGQVKHCKAVGGIFVSNDKMAAFYAAYEGVPALWIDVFQIKQRSTDGLPYQQFAFVTIPARRRRVSVDYSGGTSSSNVLIGLACCVVTGVLCLLTR